MANYIVQKATVGRLREIYAYTEKAWGKSQADIYINGMFEHFQKIADDDALSRPIPAIFELNGFVSRYQKHFIYWKKLKNGQIGIVTVLHERMHQIEQFKQDFDL